MDDQTDDDLSLNRNEDASQPLSPIVEMDESIILESEDKPVENVVLHREGDFNKGNKVETKLNLDTTMENLEERFPEPITPPEVLRGRLNSLQNDYEELKEFTELERQIYHFDCIPKEKVKSLEEEFSSLNKKVELLIQENLDYKKKLEIEDDEKRKLKSEIAKASSLHNERITVIRHMQQKLAENVKVVLTIDEKEVLPTHSILGKNYESIKAVSCIETMDPFLNSLRDLDNLLKIVLYEKKKLQDTVDNLKIEVFDLSSVIESLNGEISVYQQNLMSFKSNTVTLQEKLASIDKDLLEISEALSVTEKKRVEAELTKDVIYMTNCKLQSEMDNLQEEIISITNELQGLLVSLNDDSYIKNCSVTRDDFTCLEKNIRNSCDLFGISSSLAVLVKIVYNLKRELRFKSEECIELQLNIKHFNGHIRKLEDEINKRKTEIEVLENEVINHLPSRLLMLENSLITKESENLKLKNNLEDANKKIDELLRELSESTIKINLMKVSLHNNALEKINLEKELIKCKNSLTVHDTQTYIVSALTSLELIINSWNEKSNLGDLVIMLKGNDDILNVINFLMSIETQVILREVANKCKIKLLVHDKENNNLRSTLQNLQIGIDYLQSDNNKLRLEVNALDHIVKEEMSNRVDYLEKLLYTKDHDEYLVLQSKPHLFSEDKSERSIAVLEEDRPKELLNLLQIPNNGYEKLQKEINNLNKATKSDDGLDKIIYDLKELENIIDSWDCSEKIQISEFTEHLNEKLIKYCDNCHNSKLRVDLFRVLNKVKEKLLEFINRNNQLHESLELLGNSVKDYENKQEMFNTTIENLKCRCNVLKEESASENNLFETKYKNIKEEIKTIRKIMLLEITSLDETEEKESLMCDTLENLFRKLMQIILKKEQEISYNIEKQQKEESYNFEQEIEKLNNKLKSQESWTSVLESDNEKLNIELSALKSSYDSLHCKLKELSNDMKGKSLEIDSLKSKILELTTENDSLISNLDSTKELINNYKHIISSLEKEVEKLNGELLDKTNVIKNLEMKLNSSHEMEDHLGSEFNILSLSSLSPSTKGGFMVVGGNHTHDCQSSNTGDCPNISVGEIGTDLSETLRKEKAIIMDILGKEGNKFSLGELFMGCSEELNLLRDIIQTIGSKMSQLEMSHVKDIQSTQTTLEYNIKEMQDLKLSISKLYSDFGPDQVQMKKLKIFDESFQCYSATSLKNELDQIKSECVSFINVSEELEKSAKFGFGIIENLRETFRIVRDENCNMTKLIYDLRKSLIVEQEKTIQERERADRISKDKIVLEIKNSLLENEVRSLKLELSQVKREVFDEIDIVFPNKMQNSEKVAYINNILKQCSEDQNVYNIVTEDLSYFGYQCELMLSYIQSLEHKLFFLVEQRQHLEKENIVLKGQLCSKSLEMGHVFSEYKLLKENEARFVNENKCKQEKISLQQKELALLTKQNSSLKFELAKCEDWVRNLRSELRSTRSQSQGQRPGFNEGRIEKIDVAVQTEKTCCKRLQKKITEQKEKIDHLSAKLTKFEQHQRSSLTSSPYNKQVSYLEGALGQAKERIGRLNFALKQQESYNHDLVESLKVHESCQERLDKAYKEIEKLKNDKWPTK